MSVSHVLPVHALVHKHFDPPSLLTQVPPCLQSVGLTLHSLTSVSQVLPVQCALQRQINPPLKFEHVPPFWQCARFCVHSLMSVSQFCPVHSVWHAHWYPPIVVEHVALFWHGLTPAQLSIWDSQWLPVYPANWWNKIYQNHLAINLEEKWNMTLPFWVFLIYVGLVRFRIFSYILRRCFILLKGNLTCNLIMIKCGETCVSVWSLTRTAGTAETAIVILTSSVVVANSWYLAFVDILITISSRPTLHTRTRVSTWYVITTLLVLTNICCTFVYVMWTVEPRPCLGT